MNNQSKRRKFALLVIDMQEHFRYCAEPLLPKLIQLAQVCKSHDVLTIFTQHGHRDRSQDGGALARWWGEDSDSLIKYGCSSWKLMKELQVVLDGCTVIDTKTTYDAFEGTNLLSLLRKQGIDVVIIGGVMTNLCCETTARSAFVKNFDVILLKDGTRTNTEEMQQATLLNLVSLLLESFILKVCILLPFRKH